MIEEILDIVQKQGCCEILNERRFRYMLETAEADFDDVDDLYLMLFLKAAVYAFHITDGRLFSDGNKRAGLFCAFRFLELNGLERPVGIDDEIIALGLEIADGSVEGIEPIIEHLRVWFFDGVSKLNRRGKAGIVKAF